MRKLVILIFLVNITMMAQEKNELPYYEIPEYYSEYTVGTVAARMVDGLGFRFRWATEGLRTEDLQYKISEDGRTIEETIDHIVGLSRVIVNATLKVPNGGGKKLSEMAYNEKRKEALLNMEKSSKILQKATDLIDFNIIFGAREIPFWNNINGPIEDAVWHAGQIVAMRRASGNPIRSGVSFMMGTVKE